MKGEVIALSGEGPFVVLEVDEPGPDPGLSSWVFLLGRDPAEGPVGWTVVFDDEEAEEAELVQGVLAEAPDLLPRSYRNVVEVSARGRICVWGDGGEDDVMPAGAEGWFRVRLSRRSSGVRHRLVVQAWPADPAPTRTLRGVEEEPVDLWELEIPEAAAGLAAVARIANDVDQGPGHRTLSGEVGSVPAMEVVVKGTPRKLAPGFRVAQTLVGKADGLWGFWATTGTRTASGSGLNMFRARKPSTPSRAAASS